MAHIIVKWKELIPKSVGCYVDGYQESCETCDIEHCDNCCEVHHIAEFETKNYQFDEDKDNFDPEYFGTFTSRKTGTIKPYYLKIDEEEFVCSVCGEEHHWRKYCPNCGSRMRSPEANDRQCEKCKHKVETKPGVEACDVWDCSFEPKDELS